MVLEGGVMLSLQVDGDVAQAMQDVPYIARPEDHLHLNLGWTSWKTRPKRVRTWWGQRRCARCSWADEEVHHLDERGCCEEVDP